MVTYNMTFGSQRMGAARGGKEESTQNRSGSLLYNLTLEMIYHHFCLMLSTTHMNSSTTWEGTRRGYEYHEVGVVGSHLGS